MAAARLPIVFLLVAGALSSACDDEEAFPANAPSNDMTDPPATPPPAEPATTDSAATTGLQPPVGTPQPVGSAWVVPFPDEAVHAGITHADVVLLVTVAPSGAVEDAAVVTDPGHGFGDAARRYALGQQFKPAVDAAGTAIRATTRVRVPFRR